MCSWAVGKPGSLLNPAISVPCMVVKRELLHTALIEELQGPGGWSREALKTDHQEGEAGGGSGGLGEEASPRVTQPRSQSQLSLPLTHDLKLGKPLNSSEPQFPWDSVRVA